MKDISSEVSDYISGQMSDFEITLVQNENTAQTDVKKTDSENSGSFSSKISEGIGKGFETLQNIFIALLPFWPFFLICAIVLYFVTRNKKKKILKEKAENEPKRETFNAEITSQEIQKVDEVEKTNSGETDYSKYQPKN